MSQILVIDDDEQARKFFRFLLEDAGYEVAVAENGIHGMEYLGKNNPHLVVLDIIMPDMEGLETIRAIRRDYPDLKMIAVSGGGRGEAGHYLEMASALGAHRAFGKPVETETLLNAIEELLEQKKD